MAFLEGMVLICLHVRLSALGARLSTSIGGSEVEVRLPLPPAAPDGIGLSGGDLRQPSFEYARDDGGLDPWLHEDARWGKCFMRDGIGDGTAAVSRVGIRMVLPDEENPRIEALAAQLYENVNPWSLLVEDWLEVSSGDLLKLQLAPRSGTAVHPWLWTKLGDERELHHNLSSVMAIGSDADAAADSDTLGRVLLLAGNGQDPPLAHRLLRDARRAELAEDYRRAVLDAGTASELALTQAMRRARLRVGRMDTLGRLVGNAIKGGLPVPGAAQKTLVQPRNAVAHDGYLPDAITTQAALSVAATLVEDAHPRAQLLN